MLYAVSRDAEVVYAKDKERELGNALKEKVPRALILWILCM